MHYLLSPVDLEKDFLGHKRIAFNGGVVASRHCSSVGG